MIKTFDVVLDTVKAQGMKTVVVAVAGTSTNTRFSGYPVDGVRQ